ncbi:hypothetical protein ACFYOV_09245 [Streptomyces sp. NPDC005931]|uniref:hypothetical protein n=1 Tax=Streptomyces sp. NPDC005931 TaxID=3364737 RepID=UPI0036C1A3E8
MTDHTPAADAGNGRRLLSSLAEEPASAPVGRVARTRTVPLAPGTVHLRPVPSTCHGEPTTTGRRAHRRSLWRRTERGRLLYFPRRTPFPGPAVELGH